jgi:hypothetical protein
MASTSTGTIPIPPEAIFPDFSPQNRGIPTLDGECWSRRPRAVGLRQSRSPRSPTPHRTTQRHGLPLSPTCGHRWQRWDGRADRIRLPTAGSRSKRLLWDDESADELFHRSRELVREVEVISALVPDHSLSRPIRPARVDRFTLDGVRGGTPRRGAQENSMPIGACDPCGRSYQFDPRDVQQGYCPQCRRPLRLLAGREASNPPHGVERHPMAPPPPPEGAGNN